MIRQAGYITKKRAASSKLVDEITKKVKTSTSSSLLNAYIKQDYLDNSLRGGVPLILGDPMNPKILHTFNRVHGDIERDYNWFNVSHYIVLKFLLSLKLTCFIFGNTFLS